MWTPPPPKNRPPLSQRRGWESNEPATVPEPPPAGPPPAPKLSVVRSAVCPECGLAPDRPVTARVRQDIAVLGKLRGIEPSLAAMALVLAEQVDEGVGEDGRLLPALTKELRAVLSEIKGTRTDPAPVVVPTQDPSDDWDADLDQPV